MESDQVMGNGNQVNLWHKLINIKDNMKMIRKMDLENISGQMDPNMKDSLKMI
jgi:hypothetical protein